MYDRPRLLDTNVLVYRNGNSDVAKQALADAWHRFLWRQRLGRLSFRILQALYATLKRGRGPALDPVAVRNIVTHYLLWQPIPIDAGVVRRAWAVEERFRLSCWNAFIVAASQTAKCPILLTEDLQHGQDFNGMRVIDPFATLQTSPQEVLA